MNRISLIPLLGLIAACSGGVILNAFPRRIIKLAGVVLLYLGGSVMLLNVCSFQMCAALLACGVGSAVLLSSGGHSESVDSLQDVIRNRLIFRFLLAGMLGVIAFTATERLRQWIPVRGTVLFVSVWVSLMCLVSLAMEDVMVSRGMYLQGICLSFTLSYIYMESSALVFACFTVINLLLAFGSAVLNPDQPGTAELTAEDAE